MSLRTLLFEKLKVYVNLVLLFEKLEVYVN